MSIRTKTVVVCDFCEDESDWGDTPELAREIAAEARWGVNMPDPGPDDLCPVCLADWASP